MKPDVRTATRSEVVDFLSDWLLDGAPVEEMRGYLNHSVGRYLECARELYQLPRDAYVLEIGANPYWFSLVMTRARPDLVWMGTNGGDQSDPTNSTHVHEIVSRRTKERVSFEYRINNIETEPLPFDEGTFDAVVFLEVFEHLHKDPVASLEHIHTGLKLDGMLMLTTPNPSRAYNLQRVLLKQSIYDPFSGYGTYGRHNRESSAGELHELFVHTGYRVVAQRTIETTNEWRFRKVFAKFGFGEHHLIIGRKTAAPTVRYRPTWLYRSYPDEFY